MEVIKGIQGEELGRVDLRNDHINFFLPLFMNECLKEKKKDYFIPQLFFG